MKKTISMRMCAIVLALLTFLACLPFSVSAEDAADFRLIFVPFNNWGGIAYYLSGYEGTVPAHLTIPGTYNGHQVKYIGAHVFQGCDTLEHLTLGEPSDDSSFDAANANHWSVSLWIEEAAFSDCKNLEIVDGTEECDVREYAFANCPKLKSFRCSTTYNIREGAFSGDTSLAEINHNGYCFVDTNAFFGCTHLKNVYLTGYKAIDRKWYEDIERTGNGMLFNASAIYVHYPEDKIIYATEYLTAESEETISVDVAELLFGADSVPEYESTLIDYHIWSDYDWFDYDLEDSILTISGNDVEDACFLVEFVDENNDVIGSLRLYVDIAAADEPETKPATFSERVRELISSILKAIGHFLKGITVEDVKSFLYKYFFWLKF